MDDILSIDGLYVLEKTIKLRELRISPGAEITAPDGKFANLCVNGAGKRIVPGVYRGDVVLSTAELYHLPPHGLMKTLRRPEDLKAAVVIRDGKIVPEKSIDAMTSGCEFRDNAMYGGAMASEEDSFNGVLITGNSRYEINGLRVDFEGSGINDYVGVGAAVQVIDDSHVTISDCEFHVNGVFRCAIHAGGNSVVNVNNCRVSNNSPDAPEWFGDFAWGMGFWGSNRLTQACENTTIYYNCCDMDSNGWAIFSIDGGGKSVKIYVKDSRINLSGPRSHGYGAFNIGNRNVTSFDNCRMYIKGFPLLLHCMNEGLARSEIKNGCEIVSTEYALVAAGDSNSTADVSDSNITTGRSTFVVKGSSTKLNVDNCRLKAGNGVILQLMDNDECGMDADTIILPVGKKDEYIEGRDLCVIDLLQDVVLNMSNMDVAGDFYNSTTNFHLENDCIRGGGFLENPNVFGGLMIPEGGGTFIEKLLEEAVEPIGYDDVLRGPKNLELNFKNVRLEGVISSATAEYKHGLTQITEKERQELSNITQKAAPTVNNGVVVSFDAGSTWIITGTSYLTGLDIERGAFVSAKEGFAPRMTVDGAEADIQPGSYRGRIVIEPIKI